MHPMRRQYIGGAGIALAGGFAGCFGDDSEGTRPSGTGGPGVSVASTDEDIDLPIRPSVEVVRDTATSEHPPRLRTTLANTSDETLRVGEGIAITEEYQTFEIEAGGSSGRLVDLYATPDADGCLPVGEHRFKTTIAIVSEDAEPESSAEWGFSVLLE